MGIKTIAINIVFLLSFGQAVRAFDVEEHENIHRSLPGAKSLEIDNVSGAIEVTGSNVSTIEVDIEKTLRADDPERADAAKREVKLDVTQSGDSARFYVDGPFRCHCDTNGPFRSRNNYSERGRRGYRVDYVFHVKAPVGTRLLLSTINHGDIRVSGTLADFDFENVNGGIEAHDIAGSGYAHTVNGKVEVTFVKNPAGNSSFHSINGAVEIGFQPGLSADARFKTMNGHVYSDFDVSYLPAAAGTAQRRDGHFVYRSSDFTGVRIGAGGPELKFETLNGNIRIINRGK